MQLNSKQAYAFEQVAKGKNLFITGPGGVGKSVLIRKIRDVFGDSTIFLAPTGIAAQNIKGSTVHRAFQFPIGFIGAHQRRNPSKKAEQLFGGDAVTRIVIDEISMVRADLLTAIDQVLRRIKKRNVPFGGIQVVAVGDFFQLSPVLNEKSPEAKYFKEEFSSPFAFDTDSWRDAGFETINLDEVMRQDDEIFIRALNSVRTKDNIFHQSVDFLNKMSAKPIDEEMEPLFLCSTNKDADTINAHHYDAIDSEEKLYQGTVTGQFKDFPVQQSMMLKVGCKVLICANSSAMSDSEYYNGQTGYIESMNDGFVSVVLDGDDVPTRIEQTTWEEFDYVLENGSLKSVVVGTFKQFPIKFGWAVTIHKSQGLSLDSAVIYTGRGCFAHGQAYVALSRLRTLEGMFMMRPLGLDEVIVDDRVKKFYEDNRYANLFNS